MALKLADLKLGTIEEFIEDMVPFFYGRPLSYVDVGAFHGETFSAIVNSRLPVRESLLIEPNPKSLVKIQEVLEQVGESKTVHLQKVAVGAEEKVVQLIDSRGMTKVAHSDEDKPKNDMDEGKFTAECKTLDTVVSDLSNRHVSILKIDVEGYELEVLKGADNLLSNNDVDVIYIEAGMDAENNQQIHYRKIEDLLNKYEYRVFRFYEQMFEWTEDSPLLRRVNIAFMSSKFARENPYRVSMEVFKLKDDIRALTRQHKAALQKLEEKEKLHTQLEKNLEQANRDLQSVLEQANEKDKSSKKLAEQLENSDRELKSTLANLDNKEKSQKDLQLEIKKSALELKDALQQLQEKEKDDAKLKAEIKQLGEELRIAGENLSHRGNLLAKSNEDLTSSKLEIASNLEKLSQKDKEYAALKAELENSNKELAVALEKLKRKNKSNATLEESLKKAKRELELAASKLDKKQKKKSKLKRSLEKSDRKLKTTVKQLNECNSKQRALKASLKKAEERLCVTQGLLTQTEREHTKLKHELEKANKDMSFLTDPYNSISENQVLLDSEIEKKLRRIVFLIPDLSTTGGIQIRTKMTIGNAAGRDVEYISLSRRNENGIALPNNIVFEEAQEQTFELLRSWDPNTTAIIIPNNAIRLFPKKLRVVLDTFPLIFYGSGQLTFMLQDSEILNDIDYVKNLKVTKQILLSQMDRNVYDQLGVYNHVLGFNPVMVRDENTYNRSKNRFFGYVGRIDFYAKGAEKLINVAIALKELKLGPLKVFTTDNLKNSPQINDFYALIEEHNLHNDIDITLNVQDKEKLYRDISMLVLPSKKEGFGNVITEAFSFGVPVISSSFAPGPFEIIDHGKTGYLIRDFSVEAMKELLRKVDTETLLELSHNAFEKHKSYSITKYYDFMERIGNEAVNEFNGQNEHNVYPELKTALRFKQNKEKIAKEQVKIEADIQAEQDRVKKLQKDLEDLRNTTSFRFGNAVTKTVKYSVSPIAKPISSIKASFFKSKKEKPIVTSNYADKQIEKTQSIKKKIIAQSKKANKSGPHHVIYQAAQIAEKSGNFDQALKFIKEHGDDAAMNASNLLLANRDIQSDAKWLDHINSYLKGFNIEPLNLKEGSEPRFSRIECDIQTKTQTGPLVTVIIPAYNAEKTIRHSVGSILNQTWNNIELIIVDDASEDSTWSIIQSIAQEHSSVRIIKNDINSGPYFSKNRALQLATGEYVTGQDADDWSHPQRIEKQIKVMIARELKACMIYMLRFSPKGEFTQFLKIGKTSPDGGLRLASISCMYETQAFKSQLGYWDCVRFSADSELIGRARIAFGEKFAVIRRMGMFCLDDEGSLTNHPEHGVSKVSGMSPIRRDYRDSWTQWHKTLTPETAYIDFPPVKRHFHADEKMVVKLSEAPNP